MNTSFIAAIYSLLLKPITVYWTGASILRFSEHIKMEIADVYAYI